METRYTPQKYDTNADNAALARESFAGMFFSFKGRLDPASFLVRLNALMIFPGLIIGLVWLAAIIMVVVHYGFYDTYDNLANGMFFKRFSFLIIATAIFLVLCCVSFLSLTVRRLHDVGKNAFLALVPLLFFISIFLLLKAVFQLVGGELASLTPTYDYKVLLVGRLLIWLMMVFLFLMGFVILNFYLSLSRGDYYDNKYGANGFFDKNKSYINSLPPQTIYNNDYNVQPLTFWRKYFSFKNRIDRFTYLVRLVLWNIGYQIAGIVISFIPDTGFLIIIVQIVVYTAFFISWLSLSVRRLHDLNVRGWWFLIYILPVIGGIWLGVFFAALYHGLPNFTFAFAFGPPVAILIVGGLLCAVLTLYLIFANGTSGQNRFGSDLKYIHAMQYCEGPGYMPPLYKL